MMSTADSAGRWYPAAMMHIDHLRDNEMNEVYSLLDRGETLIVDVTMKIDEEA